MPSESTVYNAALRFAMPDSVEAYNVFDFLFSGGTATDAEVLTAIGAEVAAAYAYLQNFIYQTVSMQECKVNKVIWSGTAWIVDQIIGQVSPSFTAASTNQMLPHAVAPCVLFPTTYPKRRARKYPPGFTEDTTDGSTVVSTAQTALGSFGAELLTGRTCGTGSIQYVITTSNGLVIAPSSSDVLATVCSQRRRKPGLGI